MVSEIISRLESDLQHARGDAGKFTLADGAASVPEPWLAPLAGRGAAGHPLPSDEWRGRPARGPGPGSCVAEGRQVREHLRQFGSVRVQGNRWVYSYITPREVFVVMLVAWLALWIVMGLRVVAYNFGGKARRVLPSSGLFSLPSRPVFVIKANPLAGVRIVAQHSLRAPGGKITGAPALRAGDRPGPECWRHLRTSVSPGAADD
jgi:hypothetical protein